MILAVVLCVGISLIFSTFFTPPPKKTEGAGGDPGSQMAEPRSLSTSEDSAPSMYEPDSSSDSEIADTPARAAAQETVETTSPPTGEIGDLIQADPIPAVREVVVDTNRVRYTFSTQGGALVSCLLKNFREIDPPLELLAEKLKKARTVVERDFWAARIQEVSVWKEMRENRSEGDRKMYPEAEWVDLVPRFKDSGGRPFRLQLGKNTGDDHIIYECADAGGVVTDGATTTVEFTAQSAAGVVLVKRFEFDNQTHQFKVQVSINAPGGVEALRKAFGGFWALEWPDGIGHFPFRFPGVTEENQTRSLANDSMESPTLRDWMVDQGVKSSQVDEYRHPVRGRVTWVSLENRYFMTTFLPIGQGAEGVYIARGISSRPPDDRRVGMGMVAPFSDAPRSLEVYAGAKLTEPLTEVGRGLDRVVFNPWFEWFGAICRMVEWLLHMFYGLIPSYGLAIILLCILSKIVLYPLTYKQMQSQKKMAVLQPKIAELKVQYKDDAQKLNQEQMKLWKKHGVNPLGGCLPMLVQFPIFISLFVVIRSSIDLRGAEFLWINDLSQPDMTYFLPFSIPFLGNALNVLPFLMTGVSLMQMNAQKRMMPDPNQANIMLMMTGFFFFILYNFSSGLVLYWLTNTLTMWLQQRMMEYLGHSGKPITAAAGVAGAPPEDEPPTEEGEENPKAKKGPPQQQRRRSKARKKKAAS